MEHEIQSPMAGKILKINNKEGDKITEDDEVIVLEAMKMETPIFAPCNGTVKEIKVKQGDVVDEEDVLAIIEEG